MFISQTTYSEDSIYKRRNCNLKLKSSSTKVKRIIPEEITIAIQYRHKKRSRSQRNEASFKAKAKRPTTKNKTKLKKQRKSNSWLRGHRKIVQTRKDYLLFLEIEPGKNGFEIVSQKINFHSFSFQIAVYLTLFFFCF